MRIRATGVCQSMLTSDGQKIAGRLLVPGTKFIQRLESSPTSFRHVRHQHTVAVLTLGAEACIGWRARKRSAAIR